jgi:5,10-methylenetetrahydrofolate reductase
MEKTDKAGGDMRIDELIEKKQTISFEVFPPKPEMDANLEGIRRTLRDLRRGNPDFVSVTYGAGGNNRPRAIDIADMVISLGMVPLSHLTAIGYSRDEALGIVEASMREAGIEYAAEQISRLWSGGVRGIHHEQIRGSAGDIEALQPEERG